MDPKRRQRPQQQQQYQQQQQHVAQHYNELPHRFAHDWKDSPIYRMKNFNNWVKSILIAEHLRDKPRGQAQVLDLCSGKGGDIKKFQQSGVGYVVFADHAEQSVQNSQSRWNALQKKNRRLFQAKFITADLHTARLVHILPPPIRFDMVSCQFALHYSFESEAKARRLLQNATDRLKPGGVFVGTIPDANVLLRYARGGRVGSYRGDGADPAPAAAAASPAATPTPISPEAKLDQSPGAHFGNEAVYVKFDQPWEQLRRLPTRQPFGVRYTFSLREAIRDCPEYLVHFPTLARLAGEYGLRLQFVENFHNLFARYRSHRGTGDRAEDNYERLLGLLRVVDNDGSGRLMSADEWMAAELYCAFVFVKSDQSQPVTPAPAPAAGQEDTEDAEAGQAGRLAPDSVVAEPAEDLHKAAAGFALPGGFPQRPQPYEEIIVLALEDELTQRYRVEYSKMLPGSAKDEGRR